MKFPLREARERRKRCDAQKALRCSEAYLTEAQQLSHTGSFGWDVSSGETCWSRETFWIFACDPSTEPTLERMLQRTHPGDRARVRQLVERAAQERQGLDFEYRLLMADGSVKHVRVVARPTTQDASSHLEFVRAVTDITERRRAEEALQQAQAELSRLTRVTMLRGQLQRHRVSLQTQLAPDLPRILGDKVQLQQVMINLLLNAIEALSGVGESSRELSVSSQEVVALPADAGAAPCEAPALAGVVGSWVLVTVCDTGPGLSAQGRGRLFEAFYTTKPQGLGMGLAISRSILETHGGRLWARANVHRGAVFTFALPIRAEGGSS